MIDEDDLNSKEIQDDFNRLLNKAFQAGKSLEEYLSTLALSNDEKEAILEYRKKLLEKDPTNDGLLYICEFSKFSNVFINTKDFIQEGKHFWVPVRFIPGKLSQFHQNIEEFLEVHGCDNKNFAYIEEQWEFEPSKHSYSEIKNTYVDSDGGKIYESIVEKPKWVSLDLASRNGVVTKVYQTAMTQLVDKVKLTAKQEHIKSSSQTSKQATPQSTFIESGNQPSSFENRVAGVSGKLLATVGGIIFIIPAVSHLGRGGDLSGAFGVFVLWSVLIIGLIIFWATVTYTNISLYGWVKAL